MGTKKLNLKPSNGKYESFTHYFHVLPQREKKLIMHTVIAPLETKIVEIHTL